MPTIDELADTLKKLDDNKYQAAASYILYLAESPVEISISLGHEDSIVNDKKLHAAGSMKKYANPSLVDQEKDAWRKAAIKKYEENNA